MDKRHKFIISALGISPPGTMGGNSKIALEMARYLTDRFEVHFIVPEAKAATITDNIGTSPDIIVHTIPTYPKNDKFALIRATRFYYPYVKRVLAGLNPSCDDFVYCCSDMHTDVFPCWRLQRRFRYRWLPSAFLFVPFIVENLRRRYGFPPMIYLLGWIYARIYIFFASKRAFGFVITNKSDFHHFPQRFQKGRLFPYYGGVNIEQIAKTANSAVQPSTSNLQPFSVVFCSRLHPQKGIDAFLDVWKEVIDKTSTVHLISPPTLSIIGNGDPAYESYLKNKAERLGIADTITWLGYVNNEAKYEIYAKSDLFVHPTVFDNNGMVAAEALCTGLPVVMQDLPALRDVYTTGCLKVPFGDRAAFAAAIVCLMTDPAHYAAIAPTPKQISALHAHWRWESRAAEFKNWLASIS